MAAHYDTFIQGMPVVFSEYALCQHTALAAKWSQELGPGPYFVVKVENILDRYPCNCPAGKEQLDWRSHSDECDAQTPLRNCAHHQTVTIRNRKGKEETLSGAYLTECVIDQAQKKS